MVVLAVACGGRRAGLDRLRQGGSRRMATWTRTAVRWPQRRLAAAAVDVVALAAPVALAIVTVIVVSNALPEPRQPAREVFWWMAVAGSSAILPLAARRQGPPLFPC